MDIGSLYRKELAQSHRRGACDERTDADEQQSLETPSVPRSIVVHRKVEEETSVKEALMQTIEASAEGTMVEVGDIVDAAYRELDTAKRKADMTLATARSQASRVYREARRDARKLLSKARQKGERLEAIGKSRGEAARREAYEKGLEEGKVAALEDIRRQYGAGLDVLCAMTEDLALTRGMLVAESDERMALMMMNLLRRVVGKLNDNLEDLLTRNLITTVKKHFREDEEVFVRCNPQDLELIDANLRAAGVSANEMSQLFAGRRVQLKVDSSLTRGRCRLWSTSKGIAFSFEERLDALESELKRALAGEAIDGS